MRESSNDVALISRLLDTIEQTTDGQLPIGVYPLDTTWWGAWDGDNSLIIASPVDIEARTALSGTVVITHAKSGDRVDGFVLDLALASAFGLASEFSHVPFRKPGGDGTLTWPGIVVHLAI